MEKKYELTNRRIKYHHKTLYRIKALRAFGDVEAGELGGFVESENNLSHYGECWVYDDAKVYDRGRLLGNAQLCDNAQVFNNATMTGKSLVWGNVEIFGNAWVCENATIFNYSRIFDYAFIGKDAMIGDTSDYMTFKSLKLFSDSDKPITFYLGKDFNVYVSYKNSSGILLSDFIKPLIEKCKDPEMIDKYRINAHFIEREINQDRAIIV